MPGVSQPNFRGNHERNNGFNRHRNKTRTGTDPVPGWRS
nr:MAG TPA: hypothetical protein [Caudoviricetes sp.]